MAPEIDLNINPIQSFENTENVKQVQKPQDVKKVDSEGSRGTQLRKSALQMKEQFSEFASNQDFNKLVENVNKYVEMFNNKVSFSMDSKSRQIIYVYDKETGDLVRQIPPEEMMQLLNKLEEISGIIFNNRA